MNTNLLSDPLLHSINVANCKGIIFGENFIKGKQDIYLVNIQIYIVHYFFIINSY